MSRLRARLARLARVSLAVGATAAAGGLASSDVRSRWYVDLDKPDFQPPDAAFPLAWTALYLDLVLTAGHALDRLESTGRTAEAARYRRPLAVNLVPHRGGLEACGGRPGAVPGLVRLRDRAVDRPGASQPLSRGRRGPPGGQPALPSTRVTVIRSATRRGFSRGTR